MSSGVRRWVHRGALRASSGSLGCCGFIAGSGQVVLEVRPGGRRVPSWLPCSLGGRFRLVLQYSLGCALGFSGSFVVDGLIVVRYAGVRRRVNVYVHYCPLLSLSLPLCLRGVGYWGTP